MRVLGVGVIGYAGVARAHLAALRRHAEVFSDAPAGLRLVALAGRRDRGVAEAAAQFGAGRWTPHWAQLVEDPEVDLVVNAAPNDLHAAPSIAALRAGKAVLCEKPLGRTASEAETMARAACNAGSPALCGFNYRFVPAVLLARRLIAEGEVGRVYHFRCRYSDDSLVDPSSPFGWRHDRTAAGSGVTGDLASHGVDLAHFLVGPVVAVTAALRTYVSERPAGGATARVTVEDAIVATIEFEHGAIGTLEASGMCPGRKNLLTFEVNGDRGTLVFDLERLNELRVYHGDGTARGLADVLVTERDHPYGGRWWPPGHTLGWEHAFTHQLDEAARLTANVPTERVAATFADGWACARVCDALLDAAASGRRVAVPAPGPVQTTPPPGRAS